ncbi:MAG: tRNA1(Val) (adenine(37)-N6)-methyltransferase [Paludibacteraceae bacterium]|nr:tRNA1(Val) (adenine(37)-N6)-methyltransferase [Paludibacteraceae bacterium]
MSNTYFQFKQFRVEQEKCAMKVGTDGVLLGAWANVASASHILDIGTGTGLIALMLAQRQPNAQITAIEIDKAASEQATENFQASPWGRRFSCLNVSLQDFIKDEQTLFDLIVSNPPYFNNSLKNPDRQRSQARHTDTLSFEELMQAGSLLTQEGIFAIILPSQAEEEVITAAKKSNLYCSRKTEVLPKADAQPKRVLLEFKKDLTNAPIIDQLTIEIDRHVYTPEFKKLTEDFYLDK